jgi:excisionase family DNA binding protein
VGFTLARDDTKNGSAPRQLTLDDWAHELSTSIQPSKSVAASANRNARSGVASSRPQSPPAADAADRATALLTTHEAASLLHVHPRTIQRLVERGQLEVIHLGAAVRFDPADVAELTTRLKRRENSGPPPCSDTVKASRSVRISFSDRLRSRQHEHRADQA